MELNPTYQAIKDHTESVLIEFNPKEVSYGQILDKWHELMGTPHPTNRQYRCAIFTRNEEQMIIAQQFLRDRMQHAKYVEIEPITRFYMAEEYHQNYLAKMLSIRKCLSDGF